MNGIPYTGAEIDVHHHHIGRPAHVKQPRLVLGCTVFAFFAQNWALKHSSPSRVALLTSSESAFGALFAVIWLGESLTITGWIGGGLIVLAALWTTVHAKPRLTGHDDACLSDIGK